MSRLSFLKKNAILGVVAAAGLTSLAESASAAELRVLGAGAIEPGLKSAASLFEKQTGNTAPELRKRINGNPDFDVVIAPTAVIGDFAAASKLAETRASVGRVGMGMAGRDGAPMPDISNADALRRSVLDAESLVFNRASTGLYLENLLKMMDVYTQVESNTNRYADGASVLEPVIKGKGREIGFGAMTEILLYRGKGLKLVGPVPAEVKNYTSYTAAPPFESGQQAAVAQQFVAFLDSPGKPLFVAAGVTD